MSLTALGKFWLNSRLVTMIWLMDSASYQIWEMRANQTENWPIKLFFIISRRREGRTWLRTEARNREGAAAGIPAPERQRRAQAAGPHVPFARLRSAIGGDLDSLPRELRRKPQEAARVWGRGGELGISSSCGRRPPAACVFSGPRVREYMIIYTGRTLCGP